MVAILLTSALAQTRAQLTPADSVRLRAEIASALLEFEWNVSRPLSLRIGQAGNIPDSLIPAGFRVVGGTAGNVILESPSEVAEAERSIREHLLAKGLRLFETST